MVNFDYLNRQTILIKYELLDEELPQTLMAISFGGESYKDFFEKENSLQPINKFTVVGRSILRIPIKVYQYQLDDHSNFISEFVLTGGVDDPVIINYVFSELPEEDLIENLYGVILKSKAARKRSNRKVTNIKISFTYKREENSTEHSGYNFYHYDFAKYSRSDFKKFLIDTVKRWTGEGWVMFNDVIKTGYTTDESEDIQEYLHQLTGRKIYFGEYIDEYDTYQIVFKDVDLADNISDIEIDAQKWHFDKRNYECIGFNGDVTILFTDKEDKTFSGDFGLNDFLEEYGFFINPLF